MADSNKLKNIGGKLGVAAAVVNIAEPIVVDILDRIPKTPPANAPGEHVLMPELCSKKFPLNLSEATALLEGRGLKVLPIEVRIKDAGSKYKDCFEFQVVNSDCKTNTKLKPGDTVIVQYVTQEVIDESRKAFAEAELQKAEAKRERALKRSEQMDRAKSVVADVTEKAKTGIDKTIHRETRKKKGHRKESPNE